MSSKRDIPGSRAQGSVIGKLEYLSLTNAKATTFLWRINLTTLKIVNLIAVGRPPTTLGNTWHLIFLCMVSMVSM